MARAGSLFHTIVVVGASVGCGSTSSTAEFSAEGPSKADSGSEAGSSTGPTNPRDCLLPSQFHCDDTDRGTCSCNADAPNGPCDCPRPGEFRCRECLSGPSVLGVCPNDDGVDCFCNASIAVASPTDCPHPEQFTCSPPPQLIGLDGPNIEYAECACDPTRPLSASDCTDNDQFACLGNISCPVGSPAAEAINEPFDCRCLPPVVPIAA
jgi:hypothetical protein